MTKTSHSKIYSTESGITGGGLFKTPPLHFTKEQLEWIENIQIPKRLFLISATEFDDRYLYLHDDWRYRFSGNNVAILFSNGKYFCDLSPVSLKLLKYLTIAYINENSASVADKFAQFVATTFKQIEVITRESLIEKMQMLVAKTERNHSDCSQFYYTLYALRKLDRSGFFESKDDSNELEDLLLEVPRPRNNNWARYQNLDLVIPEEVCLMIENGIQRWASKLCPKIDVEENKNIHLETVKKTIKIDTLRDCIIIGIVYYIGARPVQIGKLSGGDFIVDTENKYGMRYSVLVPYAKKSKLTIDRVRVAIPEELGKLILLYKYLVGIGDTDPMFSITVSSMKMVEFTWNIISNNSVVMPTGGCTVDSRNVTVDLPDFPGSAEIPLGVYCSSEQKLSFYLSGATTDSSRQVFANTAPDATKASGVGVSLMRNGKILATGENVSLGTVNKSKVPLGLSATYGQTGNKVAAGTVQSVIGVTFIYE